MSNFVQVTNNELNVLEILNLVGSEDCGAISTFIGMKSINVSIRIQFH